MAENRFKKFQNIMLDEIPEEKPREKKESKFLRPGLYNDVPIVEVEDMGFAKKDPTWLQFKLTFQVKPNVTIFHYILVPTASVLYGIDKTDGPFRGLQKFCRSIGMPLAKDNAKIVLEALFNDVKKLIGLRVDLVLGHTAYYASPENKKIILRSKDDKPVLSEDGVNPLDLADFAAAEIYCQANDLEFSKYPKIKYFNPPKTLNDSHILEALVNPPAEKKKASCPF